MATQNKLDKTEFIDDVKEYADNYQGPLSIKYMDKKVDYSVPTIAYLTLDYDEWDDVLEEAGCLTMKEQNNIFNLTKSAIQDDKDLESYFTERGYNLDTVKEVLEVNDLDKLKDLHDP